MDEEASEDPKTVGKKYLCPQDNADSRQQLATGGEVVESGFIFSADILDHKWLNKSAGFREEVTQRAYSTVITSSTVKA